MFGKPPSENQEVIYHKDSKTCDKMMGDQEFQGQYINLYSFLKSCYPLSHGKNRTSRLSRPSLSPSEVSVVSRPFLMMRIILLISV